MWPIGFVTAAVFLFAIYLDHARSMAIQSDGASNVLQAWEMLHGNLLLHGWVLSDVSFYTTELPEYMLVESVRGLGVSVVHVAAALTYTLVVIGAALLAKGRAQGREGMVRALVAAGILFGPPMTTAPVLAGPDHTGTQVPLLAIWLILDRARPRWWVPAVVALILAGAQVADPLATYEGVLPLAVVCAVRLYRRRGSPVRELRGSWYELSLLAAAFASYEAAALTVRLLRHAGGWATWPPVQKFTGVQTLSTRVWLTMRSVLSVFGADFSGRHLDVHAAIPVVFLAGVALAAWGFTRGLRRFAACDLVVQVLVAATIILLAAFTVNGYPNIANGPHEIVGVLPIGAVLAGRLLAGQLIRDRHLAALGALLACCIAVTAHVLVQPPPADANRQLAAWLQAHHLSYGLAGYWNASSVTVDSGGRVQVRPVRGAGEARIVAVRWESETSWYRPTLHDARFLILPPSRTGSCTGIASGKWADTARQAFGTPAESYRVAGFAVLVWNKNLLANVGEPLGWAC
jgi:hypothetical protein